MQQPETKFKEEVLLDLAALPNAWFVKVQQVAVRGTPDILMCLAGVFIALELKKDDSSKPDRLQTYHLERIKKAGGISFVARPSNWDKIYEQLLRVATRLDEP